jgi:ABC-type multidrug transport system ATPase subunit
MTAIEVRHVSKTFGDVVAVDDLTFAVQAGEIVGLLGANGAGKTTTMRMTLGLVEPTAGEILVAGRTVRDLDRRSMGYVPQGLGLYRELTVRENLEFAAAAFGVDRPSLDGSDLDVAADRRVADLSLGLRRRVAFAVSTCHRPPVLVLDEPTSGVGPLGRARLWETIHETAGSGTAILISTHHMEEADECDRVVLMAEGREVRSGSVAELIGSSTVVEVLGDVTGSALESISRGGGTVVWSGRGVRIVGVPARMVSEIVGEGASVREVPATFEEAFVALSS